jgi:hypothetical protein
MTAATEEAPFTVQRIGNGPIVHPGNDPDDGEDNLMGAELVRVPKWVPNRLGNYYLYYGRHHHCPYIYLAYADKLQGPWKFYDKPVLDIKNTIYGASGSHVASPDIVFDEAQKRVIMLFHGQSKANGHNQSVATSTNGLQFTGENRVLSNSTSIGYLRVFPKTTWPKGPGIVLHPIRVLGQPS